MDAAAAVSALEKYIRRLEEALADYAARYGLTERARALLVEGPAHARGPDAAPSRRRPLPLPMVRLATRPPVGLLEPDR